MDILKFQIGMMKCENKFILHISFEDHKRIFVIKRQLKLL